MRKKQVAVRFNHPSISQELLAKLDIKNVVNKVKDDPTDPTFEIFFGENINQFDEQFEKFADRVGDETGKRPAWSSVFAVDVEEAAAA